MINFLCIFLIFPFLTFFSPEVTEKVPSATVIIDAGHGGTDGGAVGVNGVYEKELNLKSALFIYDLLTLGGYDAVLTRKTDDDTDGNGGKFDKKADILNRKKLSDENPDAVFVSLHMNASSSEKDRGFQVFYGQKRDGSSYLASLIDEKISAAGLSARKREVKKSASNIYLMKNIDADCCLVEFGFISNPEDCALLCDEEYLAEISSAVAGAIVSYIAQ